MSQLPTWSDSLLLGDYTIDHQHKLLIELCNRVADFTSATSPSAVEKYHWLLNELAEVAEAHFTEEENLLLNNKCPMFEAHKAEHDSYRGMLTAMLDAGHAGDLQPSNLYLFSKNYLIKHMCEMDMACRNYFK